MAPLAPWKRETWHTKVLLVLPMKSAVFSRGTTLQLPPTLRGCYTPHTTLPIASVCVRECLSPHHRGILQERACARWLISTEDTLLPLFFLLYLCFSAPPLLASDECILFTSLSLKMVAPQLTLTHTVHCTSSLSTTKQGSELQKRTWGTHEGPFMAGDATWRSWADV